MAEAEAPHVEHPSIVSRAKPVGWALVVAQLSELPRQGLEAAGMVAIVLCCVHLSYPVEHVF